MSKILAIGDSHSIFFHNSTSIIEHWVGFRQLPITWYRFNTEGLDIPNLGTIIGNGHEKNNIVSGDYVLFCYGWNDIQKNIYINHKDNYKEGIDVLIDGYFKLLKKYETDYGIHPVIYSLPPNPLTDGVDSHGSPEERDEYIKYANSELSKKCKENSLLFFNVYDIISDERGYFKEECTYGDNNYSKEGVHLDYDNLGLKDIIDNKLIKLCEEHTNSYR